MPKRERLEEPPNTDDDFIQIKVNRRTKLDLELTDDFVEQITRGLTFDCVCNILRVSPSTFWSWIRKGEAFNKSDTPPEHAIFGHFVIEARKAAGDHIAMITDRWHDEDTPQWSQWATLLERRDRKNYSKIAPQGGVDEDYDPDESFL